MNIEKELTPLQHAISGALAGIASRIIISPIDVIKIRFQLQSQSLKLSHLHIAKPKKYSSLPQSLTLIVKEEGLLGLWKGNLPAIFLYFTYGGIQFYSFNSLQKLAKNDKYVYDYIQPRFYTFVNGALAGCISTTFTYPFDLLRTRFAAQGNDKLYTSIFHAVGDIFKTEGIKGFYRGLLPSFASIVPQMGLVFEIHRYVCFRLDQIKNRPFLKFTNEMISGGIAGTVAKVITMPLDVIRFVLFF
jgi:solute carrier family 25 thiamine pyrophosphate transporter 19